MPSASEWINICMKRLKASAFWMRHILRYLVVDLPIPKMWKSIGMMTFPTYGKIKDVPNHQPVDIFQGFSRTSGSDHPWNQGPTCLGSQLWGLLFSQSFGSFDGHFLGARFAQESGIDRHEIVRNLWLQIHRTSLRESHYMSGFYHPESLTSGLSQKKWDTAKEYHNPLWHKECFSGEFVFVCAQLPDAAYQGAKWSTGFHQWWHGSSMTCSLFVWSGSQRNPCCIQDGPPKIAKLSLRSGLSMVYVR